MASLVGPVVAVVNGVDDAEISIILNDSIEDFGNVVPLLIADSSPVEPCRSDDPFERLAPGPVAVFTTSQTARVWCAWNSSTMAPWMFSPSSVLASADNALNVELDRGTAIA